MFSQVIIFFFIGLVIGSFLNVCIFRLPEGKSVIKPRSFCLQCGHQLSWKENIPLFSYIFQMAKCFNCGGEISWIYPIVELVTAFSFSALFIRFNLTPEFCVNLIFFCLLILLIFVDLTNRILPNALTIGGSMVGVVLAPFQAKEILDVNQGDYQAAYVASVLGAIVGGGCLWLVAELYYRIRKEEGLGLGDVKMMLMIGAFLGWRLAWATIFIGSILGTLIGGFYIYISGKDRRYELPYGSFLGIASVAVVIWYP